MLNLLRTRLCPGHDWVTQLPMTMASGEPLGPPTVSPPQPAREPSSSPAGSPASEPAPPAPLPGLDVSELNSDTMFDKLFGPPGTPGPMRN